MNKLVLIILSLTLSLGLQATESQGKFVHVQGVNLIRPDGEKLFIVGTNLGNWLNPEGYMFGLKRTNSAWMIDEMLC